MTIWISDFNNSRVWSNPMFNATRTSIGISPGPTFTVGPTATVPTPVVGQTGTVAATATGSGAVSYAYQWFLGGIAVGGATASTRLFDTAGAWVCRVVATDSLGSRTRFSNTLVVSAAAGEFSSEFSTDFNRSV